LLRRARLGGADAHAAEAALCVVRGVDQRPRLGLGDPHGDCASVVADVRNLAVALVGRAIRNNKKREYNLKRGTGNSSVPARGRWFRSRRSRPTLVSCLTAYRPLACMP